MKTIFDVVNLTSGKYIDPKGVEQESEYAVSDLIPFGDTQEVAFLTTYQFVQYRKSGKILKTSVGKGRSIKKMPTATHFKVYLKVTENTIRLETNENNL